MNSTKFAIMIFALLIIAMDCVCAKGPRRGSNSNRRSNSIAKNTTRRGTKSSRRSKSMDTKNTCTRRGSKSNRRSKSMGSKNPRWANANAAASPNKKTKQAKTWENEKDLTEDQRFERHVIPRKNKKRINKQIEGMTEDQIF